MNDLEKKFPFNETICRSFKKLEISNIDLNLEKFVNL